jgi:hypothetical protein
MHTAWRSDGLSTHTVWRSDGQSTHRLEIRYSKHTQPRDQMDYAHSLEIRWTKHTQTGDQMDYAHKAWRADELCIQKLEISWLHTRQEAADDTITVCLRGD